MSAEERRGQPDELVRYGEVLVILKSGALTLIRAAFLPGPLWHVLVETLPVSMCSMFLGWDDFFSALFTFTRPCCSRWVTRTLPFCTGPIAFHTCGTFSRGLRLTTSFKRLKPEVGMWKRRARFLETAEAGKVSKMVGRGNPWKALRPISRVAACGLMALWRDCKADAGKRIPPVPDNRSIQLVVRSPRAFRCKMDDWAGKGALRSKDFDQYWWLAKHGTCRLNDAPLKKHSSHLWKTGFELVCWPPWAARSGAPEENRRCAQGVREFRHRRAALVFGQEGVEMSPEG